MVMSLEMLDGRIERDEPADVEDDDASGFGDGFAKAAWAGVVEGGDMDDFAAASAGRQRAKALGAGEGDRLGECQRSG